VFTPAPLARFIVSLIKDELKDSDRLLDPCIGYNAFFSQLNDLEVDPELVGIELDEELLTKEVKAFYATPSRTLINKSFFEYPVTEKFDFIIQNPPYVRQELLISGKNAKAAVMGKLPEEIKTLVSSQSNLYIYFLIKSLFHLKENGRLLALTYDSWLYSRFGVQFKETLLKFGNINAVYHFRHYGFPDASVGATILDFRKTEKPSGDIKIYRYDNPGDIELLNPGDNSKGRIITRAAFGDYRSNELPLLEFSNDFFTKIKDISVIQPVRGTTTLANKFFIRSQPEFEESAGFIKDVTGIQKLGISEADSYLLIIGKEPPAKATSEYLTAAKQEILKSDKYKSLKKQITESEEWYRINPVMPGNIIFNYYLRRNIDFFANEKFIYTSDNFYNIKITNDFNAIFAILNSTLTKISILHKARNQGQGLKKIQLYEFKDISICSHRQISNDSLEKLDKLGENLKALNRFSIEKQNLIQEIDEILVNEYKRKLNCNFSLESLYANLKDLLK
jgi:hypothetical protein